MQRVPKTVLVAVAGLMLASVTWTPAVAQSDVALAKIEEHAVNRPLDSLAHAAEVARARAARPGPAREIVNFRGEGEDVGRSVEGPAVPDVLQQDTPGDGPTTIGAGFPGMSNNDNGAVLGFLVAPPDTDGAVGPNHYVQMINLLTAVFDKTGAVVEAPFPSNAFWAGSGGNCEPNNQGDPIVLYDDVDDRWLVSQFAFPDSFDTFSQCVAISQTGDPTGAYNRYEFSFDGFGFNDYPKHGIVSDSITMMANIFEQRGPFFRFAGTVLGVMDKAAMYAGSPATLIGFNIGSNEFGFVAGDLDGPGTSPALFATAMSNADSFDIWRIDVDWATQSASAGQIAAIPVTPFDADLCGASREACIPQPDGGPALEAISDRLMHRLQIRDFGGHRTMVTAHTVDVGNGRAGVRWYEMRETGGAWSLYQEGTYGPADGLHRWMPSAAINAAGDFGLGYMVASTSTYVSPAVTGQSAANSGSGVLDSEEVICAAGSGVQLDTARSGDYSATSVDPVSDTFWHTNEVFNTTGGFQWDTYVCEFTVGSGSANAPPTATFTHTCTDLACDFDASGSSDSDGTIVSYDWDFGDGATGTGVTTSHTYAAAGDYTVLLTVTDDGGATGTDSQAVSVGDTGGTDIVLTANGRKVRGQHVIDLSWTGATSTDVDVYRDGALIATTPNDGAYSDETGNRGGATYTHQVCEAGTTTCSNTTTTTF